MDRKGENKNTLGRTKEFCCREFEQILNKN